VECPELVNKVVGESERAVARLFHTARQAAPCILFLDHVEAIAGRRGFDTSSEQTMDRLLSTLLVEMDGVASSSSTGTGTGTAAPVIVIAATNHRDLLDEAILRPGRLDLHLELPLPGQDARAAIFAHHLGRLPFDVVGVCGGVNGLARALAVETEGLSGADIQGVCQEAAMRSLRESMQSEAVRPRHVWAALKQPPI
jgi:transitional endoplasmic reticulum ATPase